MSAVPAYAPIIRRVKDGGFEFDAQRYEHEELDRYNGSDVFCDMEIDADTEMRCFRIYDAWEDEICVIEIDKIDSIWEAANGKG